MPNLTPPRGPICYYLGRNDTDHTVLFAIGSRRYEYHLTPQQIESVEHLCKRVSILKGLNYAKRKGMIMASTAAQATS